MQESKEFFRSCPSHGRNCFKIINTCFPHLFQRSKPLPESSPPFRANPLDMIKDRNKIALSKPFPMIGNGKAMGLITDMLDEMQSR